MLRVCCGFALDLKHVFTRVFDNALGLLWVCLGFGKCFYQGVFDNVLVFFGFALDSKMCLKGMYLTNVLGLL